MDSVETPEIGEMTAIVRETVKIHTEPHLKLLDEMRVEANNWREPNPPAASATTIGKCASSL